MPDLFVDPGSHEQAGVSAETAVQCPFQRDSATRSRYAFSAHEVNHVLTSRDFWSEQGPDHRLESLSEEEREQWAKLDEFFVRWPVFSDGEHHKRMRHAAVRLLRGAVTPEFLGACERLVARQLADVADATFDWMAHVAHPLAVETLRLLVGSADSGRLIQMSRQIMAELATPGIDVSRVDAALRAVDDLHDWLRDSLAEPESRFLTEMAALWHDEEFGPNRAVALLTQIVTGAYDPIVACLGLIGERVTGELLATLPVRTLRDEVFRLATPFRFTSRYARHPVTLGHRRFDTGDRIVLSLGAANLDPVRYPNPLELKGRTTSPYSFSFGAGPHYCPGAPVAQAVVEVVLDSFLRSNTQFVATRVERAPDLQILRYDKLEGRVVRSSPESPA
jgi:cytochrome P450